MKINILSLSSITIFALSCSQTLATIGDTEVTTTRTTTVTREGSPITLSTSKTYFLVDPITGTIKGNFVPTGSDVIEPGVVIIDRTGQLTATVDPNGRIIDIITAPALDPLVTSIDNRRGELNRKITTALANGSVTAKQGEMLRADLDRVGKREAEDTSFGKLLSYSEAIMLASSLNDIADHLAFLTNDKTMQPIIGTRFVTTDGRVVVAIDDIDDRRIQLNRRIDNEYVAGKLMFPAANSLKDQLNSVAMQKVGYEKTGPLTEEQKTTIVSQLDSVETKINNETTK